jgi:hypothetical protein
MGICAATLLLATAALAGETAAPAANKGETVLTTAKMTATVTKIDLTTREVSVKTQAGDEFSFVADQAVKNLPHVKVGDTITAVYTEAIAYEVKKGGKASAAHAIVSAEGAKPGEKPAGVVGGQIKATVTVVAIDPNAPSITFKGPKGNTRTVKVRYPERLQGVAVGDAVDITYTEALAVKVEEAPKM